MRLQQKLILLFTITFFGIATAQEDDAFKEIESIQSKEKEVAPYAFKGLQICTMQSTKLAAKGEWYILISHRFGDLGNGLENFFGLDNALTKIGGIYGVTNWLSLGVSRQTYQKTYELAAKYKFANQMLDGFPVTIVGYNTMGINSELKTAINPGLKFGNRYSYTSQLIISRKFTDSFSLQAGPVFVHKNLYDDNTEQKDLTLIQVGGRIKLSKRISFNLEYASRMNANKSTKPAFQNPVTAGIDIETGGHVFQMVFSNAQQMNDVAYFSNANGNWNGKKSLFFGFNVYRVF